MEKCILTCNLLKKTWDWTWTHPTGLNTWLKTCSDRLDLDRLLCVMEEGHYSKIGTFDGQMGQSSKPLGAVGTSAFSVLTWQGSLYSRMYQWRAHTGMFCKYRPWESTWGPIKRETGCSGCLRVKPSHSQAGDFKRLPSRITLLCAST